MIGLDSIRSLRLLIPISSSDVRVSSLYVLNTSCLFSVMLYYTQPIQTSFRVNFPPLYMQHSAKLKLIVSRLDTCI